MVKKEANTWPEIDRMGDEFNDLVSTVSHLRKLLRRLYDVSIGLLIIDDEDPDGLWLERMLEAKKVMNDVLKELGNG